MIRILNHPLILKDLSILRDEKSDAFTFRASLNRIGKLLAFEITNNLELSNYEFNTPMEKSIGKRLKNEIILLPVLRAGLGLMNTFLEVIPEAKVGLIGMKRNEQDFKATEYYYNMPPAENPIILILEIMIATGGSTCDTISRLQMEGYENIKIASVISAPEGLEKIKTDYPNIELVSAALDRELNNKKYILPGLGDAGDRFCG